MCEVLHDLVIGFSSGILSSYVVSKYFVCKEARKAKEQGFKDDMQTYHRWILRIRNELEISRRIGDFSSFYRAIEEEPILHYFGNLSEQSIHSKQEASRYIHSLREKYSQSSFDEEQFKRDMGMLFKYSVDALRYTNATNREKGASKPQI